MLDCADRRLCRGKQPIELNARYLDALVLLVSESGRLVSKDRFLGEVWQGVPVTDEALTQCVKTLRRSLGDDAANPRFIETVPKHGYRFIADVEVDGRKPAREENQVPAGLGRSRPALLLGLAGTVGGGMAGLIGGIIYGFAGAVQPLAPGMGAASVLLVLLSLTIVVGLMGGAGVGFGIAAAARFGRDCRYAALGGALGGLAVGAIVKLLGLDAFALLLGRTPGDITGALEGLIIGFSVGVGAWLGLRGTGRLSLRRAAGLAALTGGVGGALVTLAGGEMMAGSLDQLASNMPGSRLQLARLGAWFGETAFGPVSRMITSVLEGALFSACVVGSILIAWRDLDKSQA